MIQFTRIEHRATSRRRTMLRFYSSVLMRRVVFAALVFALFAGCGEQSEPIERVANANYLVSTRTDAIHYNLKKMVALGNIVDVVDKRIYPGIIVARNGDIQHIIELGKAPIKQLRYIIPGFVDAHVHIESSMLVPSEFARVALRHGTVATVSDPHEIANVLGVEGVYYMINNGNNVSLKFNFGAPCCVPATPFETAGAVLGTEETEELLANPEVLFLSEVMNFPGVIYGDSSVIAKIALAQKYGLPIDGHAPLVQGDELETYIASGITTDHESLLFSEAKEKIELGMKIIIREGSAARIFDEFVPLVDMYPGMIMFGSDDLHPDDLTTGHINLLVKRAVDMGLNTMNVLRATSYTPVTHYNLDVGLIREGDPADFLVVDNLEDFNILSTVIEGRIVATADETFFESPPVLTPNNFGISEPTTPEDFALLAEGSKLNVIAAIDGQLITDWIVADANTVDGYVLPDVDNDILKIAIINRYSEAPVQVGFIRGFGLDSGAIAGSVAHDSHNIIAVGTNDEDISRAVNLIIENRGGLSVANGDIERVLALPVAGIMSNLDGATVARQYTEIDLIAKDLGSTLRAPYMTLSFMALLVIPHLKLGDLGLFDGDAFSATSVFADL